MSLTVLFKQHYSRLNHSQYECIPPYCDLERVRVGVQQVTTEAKHQSRTLVSYIIAQQLLESYCTV